MVGLSLMKKTYRVYDMRLDLMRIEYILNQSLSVDIGFRKDWFKRNVKIFGFFFCNKEVKQLGFFEKQKAVGQFNYWSLCWKKVVKAEDLLIGKSVFPRRLFDIEIANQTGIECLLIKIYLNLYGYFQPIGTLVVGGLFRNNWQILSLESVLYSVRPVSLTGNRWRALNVSSHLANDKVDLFFISQEK